MKRDRRGSLRFLDTKVDSGGITNTTLLKKLTDMFHYFPRAGIKPLS